MPREFEEARAIFDRIWDSFLNMLEDDYLRQNYQPRSKLEVLFGEPEPMKPERHTLKGIFEQQFLPVLLRGLEAAHEVRDGKSAQDVYEPRFRWRHENGSQYYEVYVDRCGPPEIVPKAEFDTERKREAYFLARGLNFPPFTVREYRS